MCVCAGRTFRKSAREDSATLLWEQCGSCGRCDQYELIVCGKRVASGQCARRAFKDPALIEWMRTMRLKDQSRSKHYSHAG